MPCASSAAAVLGVVAHREQAAVHHRVQRLHPAVEHLGEAGQRRDVAHRQARPSRSAAAVPPVEISSTPRADQRARRARRGRSCRRPRSARGGSARDRRACGARLLGGVGSGRSGARRGASAMRPKDQVTWPRYSTTSARTTTCLRRQRRRRRRGRNRPTSSSSTAPPRGAEHPGLARRQRQRRRAGAPRRARRATAGCRWKRTAKPTRPAARRPVELGAGAGVGDGQDVLAAQPRGRGRRRRAAARAAGRGSRRSRPGWRAATGRCASCAWRTETSVGPSTSRAPKVRAARPAASTRAERAAVDLDRRMRRGLPREQRPVAAEGRPGPAFTTSRWRPTLISKASVAGVGAGRRVAAGRRRRRPSPAPPGRRRAGRSPSAAAASAGRRAGARPAPGRGAPASPGAAAVERAPCRRRPAAAAAAPAPPRTIAAGARGVACWPASSSSRAVQISRIRISARSSGARDGVPPSASTSASASCAISASASAVAGDAAARARSRPARPARAAAAGPSAASGQARGQVALVRRQRPPEAVGGRAVEPLRSAARRARSSAWRAGRRAPAASPGRRRRRSGGSSPAPRPAPARAPAGCRARRGRRARGRPGARPRAAGRAAAPAQIEPPPIATSCPSARQRPATSASPRSASPSSTGSGSAAATSGRRAEPGAARPDAVAPGARRPRDPLAEGLQGQCGSGHAARAAASGKAVGRPDLSVAGSRIRHAALGAACPGSAA